MEADVDLQEGLTGLDILEKTKDHDRIIIIDAMKTSGEPGSVYKLAPTDFKDKHTLHSFSTHLNMDIPAMLELGRKTLPGKDRKGHYNVIRYGVEMCPVIARILGRMSLPVRRPISPSNGVKIGPLLM